MSKRFVSCRLFSAGILALGLALAGCSGSDGEQGPAGAPGQAGAPGDNTGTLAGTVTSNAAPMADATVTLDPGGRTATTNAAGQYTLPDVPIGVYTLSFSKAGYATKAETVSIVADPATGLVALATCDAALAPTTPVVVSITGAGAGMPGETKTLQVTYTIYDGSTIDLTAADAIVWTNAAEQAGQTTATASVPSAATLKQKLIDVIAGAKAVTPDGTPVKTRIIESTEEGKPNRTMVLGIAPGDLAWAATAATTSVRVAVKTSSGTYTASANVSPSATTYTYPAFASFALPSTGLRNVPLNQPVLVHGKKAAGTYAWSLTTKPEGSTATVSDAATQYPHFKPDVAGKYVLTDGGTTAAGALTIYAANWVGAVSGVNATTLVPSTDCNVACHRTGSIGDRVIAQFPTWQQSGHAQLLSWNLDHGEYAHYGTGCYYCHTTGFQLAAANRGIDDQAQYAGFLADPIWKLFPEVSATTKYIDVKAGNAAYVAQTFPDVMKLGNVQCENCHGPNGSGSSHVQIDPVTKFATDRTSRVSVASESCGVCHGRPTNHGRYQAWATSLHANVDEAASEHLLQANCAGCHSGQGAIEWFAQLEGGNPSRTLGTFADLGLTMDNGQPITCAVCHEPHNPGKALLDNVLIEEDDSLTDAQKEAALQKLSVRIMDETAMLPAGFKAVGVGNSALCITCHNSRNGGYTATALVPGNVADGTSVAGLHEDGDPKYGTLTSYSAPHEAAQGDVVMGRNAYFVTGVRAGHSDIGDSCVTCHMKLAHAPSNLSSATASNHTFIATLEVCAECHGEAVNAEGVEASIEAELETLKEAMEAQIKRIKGGNPSLILTPGRTPTVTVGGVETDLADYIAPNAAQLDILAKANWNYLLIEAGKGIHNPRFAHEVLFKTTQKVNLTP